MDRPTMFGDDFAAGSARWASALLAEARQPTALLDAEGVLLAANPVLLAALGERTRSPIGRRLDTAARWAGLPSARQRLRTAITAAAAGDTVRYRDDGHPDTGNQPDPSPDTDPDQGGRPDQGGGPARPGLDLLLRPARGAEPPGVRIVLEGAPAEPGGGGPVLAATDEQLRLALDSAGMGLFSWDIENDRITSIGRSEGVLGQPRAFGDLDQAISRRVHPADQARLRTAVRDAMAGRASLDVEIRPMSATGVASRWMLLRGQVHRDEQDRPVRMSVVVLDITERARARAQHARLLRGERRAAHRAAALQQITAALSEAATCEQVAAVMAEESLRTLGADAARVELVATQPIAGHGREPEGPIVRSAGQAQLLRGIPPADGAELAVSTAPGSTRVALDLTSRGRRRGRWMIGWRTPAWSGPPGTDGAQPGSGGPDSLDPAEAADPDRVELGGRGEDSHDLLRALATGCAQALDRAELYEQQRDIATVLQRTLLPAGLPEVPGSQVAARYQPGGQGVDVGGDWYDVIALPGGRTGLVIGDVEGHSAVAAAVMGQVRNALRAYAMEGCTPAIVMERLNRLLIRLRITQLVTCCYLEFAPSEGTATVVLAGHPPPLLLGADGQADYVLARPNLVLGVDEAAVFIETTVLLQPGAHLLLYTDGLVETVNRSLPHGLAALRGWTEGWDPDAGPDLLVETLIRRAREGRPVLDDVAVLAMRYLPIRRPLGGQRAVRRTFPLDPTSASAARWFVSDVLTQWGHEQLVNQVTLMASELVTNSVLHTSGELQLGLRLDARRLRVEVIDRSERLPTVQHPDADAPGGRGLLIISALAQDWGVDSRGDGKAVWFEVLLEPARRPA